MKMSRSERKAYNQGKRDGQQIGYLEGYAKGLHDGNPFNTIIEAVSNLVESIKSNPELMKQALKTRQGFIEDTTEKEEPQELIGNDVDVVCVDDYGEFDANI